MIGFAGSSAIAGDVTTAYLEFKSTSVTAIAGSTLRARITLLDAAGKLATTIDGAPISEAAVTIDSINFPSYVQFAAGNATDTIPSSSFATAASGFPLTLTNASAEFAIKYPAGTDITLGTDSIKVTVKHNTSTVATKQVPITIGAPTANVYVVRTGGVRTMPKELEEIPPQQNDNSTNHPAGDSVSIDVFAAYYSSTLAKYYFTKKLPATAAETVTISGSSTPSGATFSSSAILTEGHVATQLQIRDLKIPTILKAQTTASKVLQTMQALLKSGMTITFKAYATLVTRAVGNGKGDVNSNDELLINYTTQLFGYDFTNLGSAYNDTTIFKSDAFSKLSVVGLPINAVTSTTLSTPVNIYNFLGTYSNVNTSTAGNVPTNITALDAYYFVASPTTAKPSGNAFTVPGWTGGKVYGAVLGWDQYNNPAPFDRNGGAAVPFAFLDTINKPTDPTGIWSTLTTESSPASTGGTCNVLNTVTNTAFLPFQIVATAISGTTGIDTVSSKVYFDDTISNLPTAVKTAMSNIKTLPQAVSFNVKSWSALGYGKAGNYPPTFAYSPTAGLGDPSFTVASDVLAVTAKGFASDPLFLRPVANNGTKIGLNAEKASAPTETGTLAIPVGRTADTAEQNAIFFTKLDKSATTAVNMIIETTDKGASFVASVPFAMTNTANTSGMLAADPRDFSPSAASSRVSETTVSLDSSTRGHDTVSFTNPNAGITISDAFGNAYSGASTLEDSNAVVTVLKADGTTPYSGASGDVRGDILGVTFTPGTITAADSSAIVRITTGAATKDITVNLSALQKTALKNIYVPISAINTPVTLNFASQVGAPFTPITETGTVPPTANTATGNGYYGSFTVDLDPVDGTIASSTTTLTALITGLAPVYTFNAKPNSGKTVMTIAADGRNADASSTTLTLNFTAVDTEPPVIGAVTTSACSVSVACTDNVSLNLKDSIVKVLDSVGKDITSTLQRVDTGDGTASGSISFTGVNVGLYTLDIVLKDTAGNITTGQKPANVTTCAVAACKTVNPAYAVKGSTLDVTITGDNTNFDATSVVTFSDVEITVNSWSASSKTEIVANITISATAAASKSDVTVTTGFETIICPQAFEVRENITIPSCVSVEPSTVNAGDTTDVTITLKDIDLTKATSKLSVSFGCTGVTVTSTTVNVISATQASVTIAVAETAQDCTGDVTTTGASDVGVVCKSAFTVVAKVIPPECSLNISPSPFSNGIILPRIRIFTITGTNSAWTTSSTVTIDGINTIIPLSRSAKEIRVLAIVPSKLRLAAGNKVVTVTTPLVGGTNVCKGTLVIQ